MECGLIHESSLNMIEKLWKLKDRLIAPFFKNKRLKKSAFTGNPKKTGNKGEIYPLLGIV